METALPLVLLILTVLFTGGFMAATPYLTPKRECFAVTVPEAAQADPQIKTLKSRYAHTVVALTAAFTAAAVLAAVLISQMDHSETVSNALIGVIVLCDLLPMVVAFVLMLRNRRKVMKIKRERGWFASRQQAVALVAEEDVPGPISLAWNLLYLSVMLFVAALGAAWYPLMPDMVPMHIDFSGNVNGYAPKAGTLAFPLVITAFLGGTFFLSHWVISCSKHPTDPGAPMTSSLAYGLFARAQSVFLLVCGLALSLVIGATFMASAAGFMTLGVMAAVVCVACIPVFVGSIALAVVYGQNGSRLLKRMELARVSSAAVAAVGGAPAAGGAVAAAAGRASAAAAGEAPAAAADAPASTGAPASTDAPASAFVSGLMPLDDDEHWKLGVLYFNPDDASLWLPERFGIGWTMNLARPAAWALLGGLVLLTVVFTAAMFALVG